MIITISGLPGSGKSTIGKIIAEKLGLTFYSIGDLRGKMAMERGMTIDQLNKLGETEAWTDKEVDDYQIDLARREDNFVIDARLSWFFMPRAFKVFLTVTPEEGARRIFANPRPDESSAASVEEVAERTKKRITSDRLRYEKWYHVRFDDPANYDLVLDTTARKPEQIVEEILKAVKPS